MGAGRKRSAPDGGASQASVLDLDGDAPLAALVAKGGKAAGSSSARAAQKVAEKLEYEKLTKPLRKYASEEIPAGQHRPRQDAALLVEDVVIGLQAGRDADPPPIQLVKRGSDLQPGQVFGTQSTEISQEFPSSSVAKQNRGKYNWVARTSGGLFTRDPDKMLPVVAAKGMLGRWTCDVCGLTCSEQLFTFRGYMRKEHTHSEARKKPRTLDPFVAYISLKCGKGLLGALTEAAQFKEEVFSLASSGGSIDEMRTQLEQALRRSGREDKQILMEELARLAGLDPNTVKKTPEMAAVERLVGQQAVLLRTAEDAFRAVARSLAPRCNARLLAAATVLQAKKRGIKLEEGTYLATVARCLETAGALPQPPPRWPLEEAAMCLDLLAQAANGSEGDDPLLRLELTCSWEGSAVRAYGPKGATVTLRLGYLQARQALHAFVCPSVTREVAHSMRERFEGLGCLEFPSPEPCISTTSGSRAALSGRRAIGRAESLGFGWHSADWADRLKDLLQAKFDFNARPLRLVTGCSGAEAPHFALSKLVGEAGFEQLWGSEINENPRRFILRNCNLQHLFEDICYIMPGAGRCARHAGTCAVPQGDVDIFVGGFPCTPYSFCNPKRFKRNCFTEPAAKPFFEMRKFIAARRPRFIILENVRGLLAPNPETDCAPIEFILRGRNPDKKEECYEGTEPGADWGLEFIPGYGLKWDLFYSCDWGLPQGRPRVYIVMVRNDAGGQASCDRVFDILRACMGRLPVGSVNDFLFPPDHERVIAAEQHWRDKTKPGGRAPCTKFTEALFKTKREELGMKKGDAPYSSKRSPGWYPHATDKMVQQLDIVHTVAEKQGLDMNFLLADLSQQVSRGAWRDDGNIPTLTTGSQLYSFALHRPILGDECLWMNGFPIESLDLSAHSQAERIFLAGNAMSVPVIGAAIFAGLCAVKWGEKRVSECMGDLPTAVATRVDAEKLVQSGGVAVVQCSQLTKLAHNDDDNGAAVEDVVDATQQMEEEKPTDEPAAPEEPSWSRRAAVLLALAADITKERSTQKKARTKEKGNVEVMAPKLGLAGAMSSGAVTPSDDEEDAAEGDGLSWQMRMAKIESGDVKEDEAVRWLTETSNLLRRMKREERIASGSGLVQFVEKTIPYVKEFSPLQVQKHNMMELMGQLWREAGFPQVKGLYGQWLTHSLLEEVKTKQLSIATSKAWIQNCSQLTNAVNASLSASRLQILASLPPTTPGTVQEDAVIYIWCKLLQAWRNDMPQSREEPKQVTAAMNMLMDQWLLSKPAAFSNLRSVLELGQVISDLKKGCDQHKKPESAQGLQHVARRLREEAPCRYILHVLRAGDYPAARDFARIAAECRESVPLLGVLGKLVMHMPAMRQENLVSMSPQQLRSLANLLRACRQKVVDTLDASVEPAMHDVIRAVEDIAHEMYSMSDGQDGSGEYMMIDEAHEEMLDVPVDAVSTIRQEANWEAVWSERTRVMCKLELPAAGGTPGKVIIGPGSQADLQAASVMLGDYFTGLQDSRLLQAVKTASFNNAHFERCAEKVMQVMRDRSKDISNWCAEVNSYLKEIVRSLQAMEANGQLSKPQKSVSAQLLQRAAREQRTRQEKVAQLEMTEKHMKNLSLGSLLMRRGTLGEEEIMKDSAWLNDALPKGTGFLQGELVKRAVDHVSAFEYAEALIQTWRETPQIPPGWQKGKTQTGMRFFYPESTPDKTQWNIPLPTTPTQQVSSPMTPPKAHLTEANPAVEAVPVGAAPLSVKSAPLLPEAKTDLGVADKEALGGFRMPPPPSDEIKAKGKAALAMALGKSRPLGVLVAPPPPEAQQGGPASNRPRPPPQVPGTPVVGNIPGTPQVPLVPGGLSLPGTPRAPPSFTPMVANPMGLPMQAPGLPRQPLQFHRPPANVRAPVNLAKPVATPPKQFAQPAPVQPAKSSNRPKPPSAPPKSLGGASTVTVPPPPQPRGKTPPAPPQVAPLVGSPGSGIEAVSSKAAVKAQSQAQGSFPGMLASMSAGGSPSASQEGDRGDSPARKRQKL